ncbi:hypothetical protein [Desulfobaculum bizertense]|uniref:hypothetical protein n=1 Tax=Desulfobaculum bizertense TaxID=376490 RepID=UPI0013562B84|nr:hypothetical protein [Desulfobaculum bizertense]UIJ37463.1 hypothetical protein LWC08_12180 [Desulfobaculum bizertense]
MLYPQSSQFVKPRQGQNQQHHESATPEESAIVQYSDGKSVLYVFFHFLQQAEIGLY